MRINSETPRKTREFGSFYVSLMAECKIGYFTAEAIGASWLSLGIARSRNGYFYSVEFTPDRQVFCEHSTIASPFEIPAIDIIKSRQFAELQDGSFVSIINDKELTVASSVTATILDSRLEHPERQFIERALGNYLRHHRVALVNGTMFTTKLLTGKSVSLRIDTAVQRPKLFALSNTTRITYVQPDNAVGCVDYPSFREAAALLKRYATFSMFNAAEAPNAFSSQPQGVPQQNIHPKGCVVTGTVGSGRGFLVKRVADLLKLKVVEIDGENFESTQMNFPALNIKVAQKSIVLLRNIDMHLKDMQTAFERRIVNQVADFIDRTNGAFFAMTALSKDIIPDTLISAQRLGFSLCVPPLSTADLKVLMHGKFEQSVMDLAVGLSVSDIVNAESASDVYDAVTRSNKGLIQGSVAQTKWEDIGGLSATKRIVREAVEWPITRAADLRAFGVRPPRGVLLYGPPGCGKTMIARAIATSLSSSFFSISAASVFQMYLGESERVIRELFALARQKIPSVVFIDEIDAMVGKRGNVTGVSERVLSTFLNEMDGISPLSDVVVVAATNRKDALDEALCRPGRFDCLVEVCPCNTIEDVKDVLAICARNMPLAEGVAETMVGVIPLGSSGAEIDNLCREAALAALNRNADVITSEDFEVALLVSRRL